MKYLFLLLLIIPLTSQSQTQCFSDAMCPTGQECVTITQHYSLCLPENLNSGLNCKNCINNACTRPPSGVDADNDQIPDRLEHDLARRFFPNLMLRDHAEDTGEFYGTITQGDIHTIPYRLRRIPTSDISKSAVCGIYGPCLEIRYGLPYDYDHGDGVLFWQNAYAHEGDSEFIAFVIYSDQPQSISFNDPNSWKIGLARANHHTSNTIKSFYSVSFYPTFTQSWGVNPPLTMWAAEKKHATYFSKAECNDGGINFPFAGPLDNCNQNNFNVRSSILDNNRLQNIGEPSNIIDSKIHYPNVSSTTSCTEYDVYGFNSFSNSSGFRGKFISDLNW